MSDLLGGALPASIFTGSLASIVYLVWSGLRAHRAGLPRSPQSEVRFEAVWGMVLAAPALIFAVGGATASGGSPWLSALLLVALAMVYAPPVLALARVHLPKPVRVAPATVAIAAVPTLVLWGSIAYGDVLWFIMFSFVVSKAGVGYVADCMVGVRFARAVARLDAERMRERESARLLEPGFVWPT